MQEQVQRQEDELQRLREAKEDLRAGLRSAISGLASYLLSSAQKPQTLVLYDEINSS